MPPIKDLRYSQLVIIRVSHADPIVTSHAANALREALASSVTHWADAFAPHLKPQLEVLTAVGSEDFPFREISQC